MFKNCEIVAVGTNPDEYHAVKPGCERGKPGFVMSSSSLRGFVDCAEKWKTPIVDEDGTTGFYEHAGSASTQFGDLFDTLLLTPQHFEARFAVRPETYVKDGETKKWTAQANYCKEWKAAAEEEGRTIISRSALFKCRQAITRFRQDEHFKNFIDPEQSEFQVWIAGEWHDLKRPANMGEPTGMVIPVKCLLDIVTRTNSVVCNSIADVKTAQTAKLLPWDRWADRAGYPVQAAWYTDMFVAASNREISTFCFLVIENTPPFQVGRRKMSQRLDSDPEKDMDPGDLANGRRSYRKILALYCDCLKTGKWFNYDSSDESDKGWTEKRPNPFADQFLPKYGTLQEDEEEPNPADESDETTKNDLIP